MPDIPLIDILPDHWEIVRDILKKHVPQYEVWAFGSCATWTAKPYSDLDLAVITVTPMSLQTSADLSDDFSESDLPWKVDVLDWASTSPSFREIVERDKVVVQTLKRAIAANQPRGVCPTVSVLPDGWQVKRLGSFCDKIGTGATPHCGSEVYVSQRIHALIRSQNVFDRRFDTSGLAFISDSDAKTLRSAEVKRGDLLLNITGDGVTFGRSCAVPDHVLPAGVNQHVSIVRPDPSICLLPSRL